MPLSGELSLRCQRLLIRFDDFDSHQSLKTIFIKAAELKEYETDLPEATSRRDRVNKVMAFLLDKYSSRGSVFVLFLNELFSQVPKEDERYTELKELVPLVAIALSSRDYEYRKVVEEFDFGNSTATPAAENDAEQWFEAARESGIDELAFRIALVVLNGAEYKAFSRAYKNLAALLSQSFTDEEDDKQKETPARKSLPIPESKRLRNAGAQRLEKQVEVTSGSARETISLEVVELCDPNTQLPLLSYFWRDYSFCRNEVTEWLTDLAAGQTADIRIRVAVGVGAIAINNFASIRDAILNRWAQGEEHSAEYRAAVGRALGVAIQDENRTGEVAALLRLWSASDNYFLRWAAARAYLYVGLSLAPGDAVRQWRTIASSEEPHFYSPVNDRFYINPLILSLLDAMRTFFITALDTPSDVDEVFRGAVTELRDWVTEDVKQDQTARYSLMLFTMLMQMNRTNQTSDAASTVLLSLIDVADPEAAYFKDLVEIFYLAMRDEITLGDVRDQLEQWVGQIDGGAACNEDRLLALLRAVIKREQPRTRLRELMTYYLGKWKQKAASPSPAAERILARLN
jgi:hypothetical protein